MPEFILDHGSPEGSKRFAELDAFTQGYIEAMFFTATDWNDTDEYDNPNDTPEWSFDMLAPETLESIIADFQAANATLLSDAYYHQTRAYSEHQAGTDFWFTRNGHGAGFWDRGLGQVGNDLSDMARPYGETDLYRGDDDQLYIS